MEIVGVYRNAVGEWIAMWKWPDPTLTTWLDNDGISTFIRRHARGLKFWNRKLPKGNLPGSSSNTTASKGNSFPGADGT